MEFTLVLTGQIRGGKNNMGITKNGIHYPKPKFVKWRNEMLIQVRKQFPNGIITIGDAGYLWTFKYVPEDKRRRDVSLCLTPFSISLNGLIL